MLLATLSLAHATLLPGAARPSVGLSTGLADNLAAHAAEMSRSASLGFRPATAAVPTTSAWEVHRIDRRALGMGPKCPFESDDLVITTAPVLSAHECRAIREEAAQLMARGARSSFTMTDTNRDVNLHDLPRTVAWLNGGAFARLASLAAECFPSAVGDATDLWVYRGLVVQYDAAAGLTHQPTHRDGALISCVIPLSERAAYEGGGTFVEPLGRAIALEQGCALLHPSAVRHAGQRIHKGERWVLALFLNVSPMLACEHGRRFRVRAQEVLAQAQLDRQLDALVAAELAAEEEEEDEDDEEDDDEGGAGEQPGNEVEEEEEGGGRWEVCSFRQLGGRGSRALRAGPLCGAQQGGAEAEEEEDEEEEDDDDDDELACLLHALWVTRGANHEVLHDLGAHAHARGRVAEALRLYERAAALNAADAPLLGHMGVAHLELGRRRQALRCYRRALAADEHDVDARFSAGELLLVEGRLRALSRLLAEAPGPTMRRSERLQELAKELEVAMALKGGCVERGGVHVSIPG